VKTLKITTHWTPEEADCIYQFLGELQSAIWEAYGDDIEQMHRTIWAEQKEREKTFYDDIPF
jgi:hypothetical protein